MKQKTPSEIPVPAHLEPVLRKYKSLGSVVKANDDESLRLLLDYQKEAGKLDQEVLNKVLVAGAPTMTPTVANVLFEFGADPAHTNEGMDIIQAALSAKNSTLVLSLLDQGLFHPDHAELDGTTLLMAALLAEQFDLADELVQRGADVNMQRPVFPGNGETALHLAARQASFQSVIWLIENGADPTIENVDNHQPSELIPELDKESAHMWDLDVMYEALEDYKQARKEGKNFEIPERLREMAYLEATPMSAMEAAVAKMAVKEAEKKEKSVGILPKAKKIGF